MDREALAETWRERLDDYAHTEMRVQDWCDFNRVSTYQFYYWRRKLAAADIAKSGNPTISHARTQPWLAVDLGEPARSSAASGRVSVRITLEEYPGAAIELQPDFNPALLRAVVGALATDPC